MAKKIKKKRKVVPATKLLPLQKKKKVVKKVVKKKKATEPQKTEDKEKYAYTIKDKHFGEFSVLKTANAWWLESIKVEKLIDAFKMKATVVQARLYAGISRGQWEYFIKLHPEFSGIMEDVYNLPNLVAKNNLVKKLQNDEGEFSLRYLERVEKNEYSLRQEHTGAGGGPIETKLSAEEQKQIDDVFERNS